MKRKGLIGLLILTMLFASVQIPGLTAQAATVATEAGVTQEMCKASYWKDSALNCVDRPLMNREQIEAINEEGYQGKGTGIQWNDPSSLRTQQYITRDTMVRSIIGEFDGYDDLYVDGVKMSRSAYLSELAEQAEATALDVRAAKFAVCTTRTEMRAVPTDQFIGYSAGDTDDEGVASSLIVNEPFLVKQECTIDGILFYWGKSNNCSGWVKASDVAVCADFDQWVDAWKVDPDAKDFLVVTQSKLTLEASYIQKYSSKVMLNLGCTLKLLTDEELAAADFGERNSWHNYAVWLPTRKEDGFYEKKAALLASRYSVSIGYADMTQGNILDYAFSCLGDRYGWGGSQEALDCSAFTRTVYKCFGMEIPRNTTWQTLLYSRKADLSGMDEAAKAKYISTLPIGTLLYFPGHTMIYIGTENGVPYVISALGSAVESTVEVVTDDDTLSIYNVAITPLMVKRSAKRGGQTWLYYLNTALIFSEDINNCSQAHHIYTSKVTKEASYVADGVRTYTCKYCGRSYTESIAKKKLAKPGSLKLTAKKGALTVKFGKVKAASGYQIQYSLKKSFAKKKTVTAKGNKHFTKTIKKLKRRKRYYVRVRAYVSQSGKKAYSAWKSSYKKTK